MPPAIYNNIVAKLQSQRESLHEPVRLPVERDLARELQVGRDTVRRALAVLERRGAVTRRRGSGTYLQPVRRAPVLDLRGSNVGFVPPHWAESMSSWYTSMVFEGIARWADENECHISVLHADRRCDDPSEWMQRFRERNLAGVIWVHPMTEQLPLIEHTNQHLPTVVLGRCYLGRGLHHVMPDYEQAVQLMDDCLVGMGHEQYAVVGASILKSYSQTWLKAFAAAFENRGAWFDVQQSFIDIKALDRAKLGRLLLEFYQPVHPHVQAYVLTSSSYLMPLVADEEFRRRMKEDISVVAFDFGLYPMDAYWPGNSVTHIRCDWPQVARRGMEALGALAAGDELPEVMREPVTFQEGRTVRAWRERENRVAAEAEA